MQDQTKIPEKTISIQKAQIIDSILFFALTSLVGTIKLLYMHTI